MYKKLAFKKKLLIMITLCLITPREQNFKFKVEQKLINYSRTCRNGAKKNKLKRQLLYVMAFSHFAFLSLFNRN